MEENKIKKTKNNKKIILFKILKYSTILITSSYLTIKFLVILKKIKPNIFIVPKKLGKIGKYYKGGFLPKMNLREACLILGVTPRINKNILKETHKKLIMLNHPDFGGSTYISCKINEAKELLMKEIEKKNSNNSF